MVVTFYSAEGENTLLGNVTSEDLGSGKKETAEFTGTKDGDKITVKFKGNPPVVGAASEWTDKPWIMKKEGGKETLKIVFNAKNYESNRWEEINYDFALVSCK